MTQDAIQSAIAHWHSADISRLRARLVGVSEASVSLVSMVLAVKLHDQTALTKFGILALI